MDYRDTLNLPDQEFTIPMRAGLPALEPTIQRQWEEMGLYYLVQKKMEGKPKYIFHDGPPYTNYPIHMGTAMNRILKDFITRFKTMDGQHTPYIPGFDNHGLPIELAVIKKFREQGKTPSKPELIKACREHAQTYIDLQTEQSKRLGVLADWDRPYTTMAFAYEARLVRAFGRMVKVGYVYRGLKPVMWCPSCSTALAEAEIEYEDHTSDSIHVAFPLLEDPDGALSGYTNVHALIWTTTPWTIPANLAIAAGPGLEYSLVRVGDKTLIVSTGLVESVMTAIGADSHQVVGTLKGKQLESAKFKHPIFDRPSVAVMVDYVREEEGTGLVHTAPGHGADDFYTGKKYGLEILCPVDANGVFTADAGEFVGLPIAPDGNKRVIERLAETGTLMSHTKYKHSYPHCWRCHNPLIFRATDQWFVNMEHNGLREKMLKEVETTSWIPAHAVNRIRAMVENRPDWCISRQRTWGIPIPAFYAPGDTEPLQTPEIIEKCAEIVDVGGVAAWFEASNEEVLGPGFVYKGVAAKDLRKESDILDVWFDSGCSHWIVLDSGLWPELSWPADLYLEGTDQHRGWFNTSLIMATALKGSAPYRAVLTHGFVLDDKYRKMSKSLGNVLEPMEMADKHGADILRLWVANISYFEDVAVSETLLQQHADSFRRVRNTLRFLIANLYDYDESKAAAPTEVDRWAIHEMNRAMDQVRTAFREFEFHRGWNTLQLFCSQELSAFYMDVTKDRMYCEAPESEGRRAGQATYLLIASTVCRAAATILAYSMEEVWDKLPLKDKEESVHLTQFPGALQNGLSDMEAARWGVAMNLREDVNRYLEAAKQSGVVKDTQEASVELMLPAEERESLGNLEPMLDIILKVSLVTVQTGDRETTVSLAPGEKCERCWLRRTDVGTDAAHPTLCARCASVIHAL